MQIYDAEFQEHCFNIFNISVEVQGALSDLSLLGTRGISKDATHNFQSER